MVLYIIGFYYKIKESQSFKQNICELLFFFGQRCPLSDSVEHSSIHGSQKLAMDETLLQDQAPA